MGIGQLRIHTYPNENLTSMNHSFAVAHQMSTFSYLKSSKEKKQIKWYYREKQEKKTEANPERLAQERKRKKFNPRHYENRIRAVFCFPSWKAEKQEGAGASAKGDDTTEKKTISEQTKGSC